MKTLDWVPSYLTDHAQLVKVDDASSTVRPLHWGVPQGSVLGPMPYCIHFHWVILLVSMACRFTLMLMTPSFIHLLLATTPLI